MPRLRKLDHQGDSVLDWERTSEEDKERVRREFDRLVDGGKLAYRVDAPGKGSQIREFDPEADEIIVTGPLVGG